MNLGKEERNIVAGMWKFKDSVGKDTLLDIATEWRKAEPDRYGAFSVRRCSKNQLGICFSYRFEGDNHNAFYDLITDQLKRQFGNDYVGWDITSDIWTLPDTDWTVDPESGRANSSPEFARLTSEVAKLIRGDGQVLSPGQVENTAVLILARLAHVHGLVPSR